MDQMLVAAFFLVNAFAFTAGYYIGNTERKSRRVWVEDEALVFSDPLKPEEIDAIRARWSRSHSNPWRVHLPYGNYVPATSAHAMDTPPPMPRK